MKPYDFPHVDLQTPLFYNLPELEGKKSGRFLKIDIQYKPDTGEMADWKETICEERPDLMPEAKEKIELARKTFLSDVEYMIAHINASEIKPLPVPRHQEYGVTWSTDDMILYINLSPENCGTAKIYAYDRKILDNHLQQMQEKLAVAKEVKFFYRAHADHFPIINEEWNERAMDASPIDDAVLAGLQDFVKTAIHGEQMPQEYGRGLQVWYDKDDSLFEKMVYAQPDVVVVNNRLWGVARCLISEDLTTEEEASFKGYWLGQMSDGWGEGFEQRPIQTGAIEYAEVYVHFWEGGHPLLNEDEFESIASPEHPAHGIAWG